MWPKKEESWEEMLTQARQELYHSSLQETELCHSPRCSSHLIRFSGWPWCVLSMKWMARLIVWWEWSRLTSRGSRQGLVRLTIACRESALCFSGFSFHPAWRPLMKTWVLWWYQQRLAIIKLYIYPLVVEERSTYSPGTIPFKEREIHWHYIWIERQERLRTSILEIRFGKDTPVASDSLSFHYPNSSSSQLSRSNLP